MDKLRYTTESPNPNSEYIDRISTIEAVKLFIDEDKQAFKAVESRALTIAQAVDMVADAFQKGGRLIYIGAGTSGRLGALDAAECPPTFGVTPNQVISLIAGGKRAFTKAVEGAEDNREAAKQDLIRVKVNPCDVVVGITASGTTPYVRAGLQFAHSIGAKTILIACNQVDDLSGIDLLIDPLVGPEIISGSTRLKSGTACKLILNMISTLSMIKIGKVYKNLMVDVVATNEKLRRRAKRLVMLGGGVDEVTAEELLQKAKGQVKTAIFMAKRKCSFAKAKRELAKFSGNLAKALGEIP